MKKVMLIAPYQGMANVMKNMALPRELDISVKVANLNDGVNLAIEAEQQGYDFIISRGGTATLIEQAVSIPVIHIDITGYDILRIFTMITGIDTKVALVGFPNISEGAATICSILEYDVKLVTIDSQEEVEDALWKLKSEGYPVVIGDVVTVDHAQKAGLQGILLTSGKEAILDAFKTGIRVTEMLKNRGLEYTVSKQVFESIPLPIVILNTAGDMVYQNKSYIDNFYHKKMIDSNIISAIVSKLDNEEYIYFDKEESITYKLRAFDINTEEKFRGAIIEILKSNSEQNLFHMERVKENIHIIGVSKTTQKLARLINYYNEVNEKICIVGEYGTGKKTLAKAIHYKKFGPNIPLYFIDAADLLNYNSAEIKEHLNRILIGSIVIFNIEKLSSNNKRNIFDSIEEKVQLFIISTIPLDYTGSLDDFSTYSPHIDKVSSIHLLPLRVRKEDIEYFINYYLTELNAEIGLEILGIKEDALKYLKNYNWNGNIIELKKTIKEISLSAEGHFIELKDVKFLDMYSSDLTANKKEVNIEMGTLKDIEKQIIEEVLKREEGNQSRAAKKLGIDRSTLWRKLNS